jgi:hypothetical protein
MRESPDRLHVTVTHLPMVSGHVLAASASGSGWIVWLFIVVGIMAVVGYFKEKAEKRRKELGLPPKPPRQPMDISPATASLLSGTNEPSYKPRGITAVTPSGIRVSVRCPHRSGHRSPDLAVACGQREKDRIERTGR